MDDVDRSSEILDMQMALFERQRKENFTLETPVYHTICRYCKEDPTENGGPYCCEECKEDDERLQKAKQRNGQLR